MGMGLTTWAMLVNRFFSSAVRLEPDRGQQVVSSGPYRLVRHPGYSGGLLLLLSAGVALGSWIAIVPILLIVPFMVRRTLIEERMLADALPGYVGYMQRVRSRIVPGSSCDLLLELASQRASSADHGDGRNRPFTALPDQPKYG